MNLNIDFTKLLLFIAIVSLVSQLLYSLMMKYFQNKSYEDGRKYVFNKYENDGILIGIQKLESVERRVEAIHEDIKGSHFYLGCRSAIRDIRYGHEQEQQRRRAKFPH